MILNTEQFKQLNDVDAKRFLSHVYIAGFARQCPEIAPLPHIPAWSDKRIEPSLIQRKTRETESALQAWAKDGVLLIQGVHFDDDLDINALLDTLAETPIDVQSSRDRPTSPDEPSAGVEHSSERKAAYDRTPKTKLKALIIDDCLVGGSVLADSIECETDFLVTNTIIKGRLSCEKLRCGGDFRLTQVEIYNAKKTRASPDQPSIESTLPADTRDWIALDGDYLRVGGSIVWEGVRVGGSGRVSLKHAIVEGDVIIQERQRPGGGPEKYSYGFAGSFSGWDMKTGGGIKLQGVRIGDGESGVYLGSTRLKWCLLKDVEVCGDVNFDNAKIEDCTINSCRTRGTFNLQNLSAGRVKLWNLCVEGAIDMRTARIGSNLQIGCKDKDGETVSTICNSINLSNVSCGGNGDLSGLRVSENVHRRVEDPGSVIARGARFDGALAFYEEERGNGVGDAKRTKGTQPEVGREASAASIDRELDLSDATIRHLQLSGKSFGAEAYASWIKSSNQEEKERARPTVWLKVEGGKFDTLSIRHPPPVLMSFAGAEIRRWDLEKLSDASDESELPSLKDVKLLLERTWPFNRGTYLAVARFMHDEGRDEEAASVEFSMRRRIADPQNVVDKILRDVRAESKRRSPVEIIRDGLRAMSRHLRTLVRMPGIVYLRTRGRMLGVRVVWGPLLYPKRATCFLLFTVAISWMIFSVPDNIVASDEHASVAQDCQATGLPKGQDVSSRDPLSKPFLSTLPAKSSPGPCKPINWTTANIIAMVMRYHLPTIGFALNEDWQPKSEGPTSVRNPASLLISKLRPWSLTFISPLGYAIGVVLMSWVMVPLTIIGFSGLLRIKG